MMLAGDGRTLQKAGTTPRGMYLRKRSFNKNAAQRAAFSWKAVAAYSFWLCMKRSKVASVKRNHRFWSERNLA
jgi:hypothetical protein